MLSYNVAANTVNNTTGQINFSASTLTSPPLNGTFTVATIRVRVRNAVTAGTMWFVQELRRHTDLYAGGGSLQPLLDAGNAYRLYLPVILRQ